MVHVGEGDPHCRDVLQPLNGCKEMDFRVHQKYQKLGGSNFIQMYGNF